MLSMGFHPTSQIHKSTETPQQAGLLCSTIFSVDVLPPRELVHLQPYEDQDHFCPRDGGPETVIGTLFSLCLTLEKERSPILKMEVDRGPQWCLCGKARIVQWIDCPGASTGRRASACAYSACMGLARARQHSAGAGRERWTSTRRRFHNVSCTQHRHPQASPRRGDFIPGGRDITIQRGSCRRGMVGGAISFVTETITWIPRDAGEQLLQAIIPYPVGGGENWVCRG